MLAQRFKLPIWILPVLIAGLASLLDWWGDGRLRNTIEEELKAQLTATLKANVTALGIWSTNQTRLATALAEDSAIRASAVAVLLAPPPPPPARREFRPQPELAQFVNDLRPRLPQLGYGTAQLVSTNFMV